MSPLQSRILKIVIFIFCPGAALGNVYSFQSVQSNLAIPQDKMFYLLDHHGHGYMQAGSVLFQAEANFRKIQKETPTELLTPEGERWKAEAKAFITKAYGYHASERRAYITEVLDSPATGTRIRSLAEHIYLAESSRIDSGDQFNTDSVKKFLLETQFLKMLLYGAGRSDEEKIRLLNNHMKALDQFFAEGIHSKNYRYVRLGSEEDIDDFLKQFTSKYSNLEDEFLNKPKTLELPAGVLGDFNIVHKLHALIHFSNETRAFKFTVSLYDLDPKMAERLYNDQLRIAIDKIQETYKKEVRKSEEIHKGYTDSEIYKSFMKVAEATRDTALESAPRRVDYDIRNVSIGDLITPDGAFRGAFQQLPDQEKLKVFKSAEIVFESKWQQMRKFTDELVKTGQFKFANAADERFFTLLLQGYFEDLSFEESKNIIKALIERRDQASGIHIFRQMILNAGPQMQKLLQVMGRKKEFSPELRNIFSQVEEEGLASPWEKVKKNFQYPPEGTTWVSFDTEPKVGSMAQTYKTTVKDASGKLIPVAARVLKYGVETKLAAEEKKIENLARLIDQDPLLREKNFPLVTPLLSDIRTMTREELDINRTKQNQILAESYRTKIQAQGNLIVEFATPETLNSKNQNVLYSTWVSGDKFDTFQAKKPELAKTVAEAIATHWAEVAFYQGRFFHPDLHQGNFKIDVKSENHVVVSFLDFGMMGQLSAEARANLMKLSAAKYLRSEKAIAQNLWALLSPGQNTITYSELTMLVANHPSKYSLSASQWIEWALSKGLKFGKDITAFSRGVTAIDQMLVAAGAQKRMPDIMFGLAKTHLGDTLHVVKDAIKDRFTKIPPKDEGNRNSCSKVFGG